MSSNPSSINQSAPIQPTLTKTHASTQTSTKTPDYYQEMLVWANEGTLHADNNKASFSSALDKISSNLHIAKKVLAGAASIPLFITAIIFFPLTITGAWLTTTGQNQRVLGEYEGNKNATKAGTIKYNIGCALAIALRLGLMCSYYAMKDEKSS